MPRHYRRCSLPEVSQAPVALLLAAVAAIGGALPSYAAGAGRPPAERASSSLDARTVAGSQAPLAPARAAAAPLAVALASSTNGTDVGYALELRAIASGGVPPYEAAWSDSVGDVGVGTLWSLVPGAEGNLTVSTVVTDANGSVAFAHRSFRVAAPPRVTIDPAPLVPGAEGAVLLEGAIAGGTAPYRAALSIPGAPYDALFDIAREGPFSAPARVSEAGGAVASLALTDAVNASSEAEQNLSVIPLPPLLLTAGPSPVHADANEPVHLLLVVSGAVSPAGYEVASAQPVENESSSAGSIGPNGTVAWSGALAGPGNDSLIVSVRDGAGRSVVATVTVLVAAPLVLFLSPATAHPSLGSGLRCTVTIAGGTAPYAWLLATSDGTAATGNASAPGSFNVSVTTPTVGDLALRFEVWDAWGAVGLAPANVSVVVDGTPDPGAPVAGPTASDAGTAYATAIAAVVGAALASIIWWRRSRRRPDERPVAPGALPEVRRLLSGGAQLDRETLGVLAEERGVARADAEAALDRWVRAGRVEVDRGDDGAERFRWSEPTHEDDPLEEVP